MSNFRKFFAPLKYDKKNTIAIILLSILRGLNIAIIGLSTSWSVKALQNGNMPLFRDIFWLLTGITILHFCTFHPFRIYGQKARRNTFNSLEIEYYKRFTQLENNYVEKYGTGKIKSIISS